MKIPVLDTNKKVLAPTSPRRARLLLSAGKASVLKRFPFTIILKREIENPVMPDLKLKVDPGSKTTGLALVNQATGEVIFAAELSHHGQAIKASLDSRRSLRRGRRTRKTRYRKARFLNRTRPIGWLAPSLNSRICNVTTWANRLSRVYPISGIAFELVKFDMQLMQNAEISGVEYQQGELQGYEVREYLLQKFGRKCAYCKKENVPLQIEHITPKAKGGSSRVSNLTLACEKCNLKKGKQTAEEFGFPKLQAQARLPLKDAAAVNVIRFATLNALKFYGFEVETGSGALTKMNRTQRNLPKTHWLDAACVGTSTPETLLIDGVKVLAIQAMGHGNRQRCSTNKFGFPIRHRTRNKTFMGFKTGDYVQANVMKGKFAGKHVGRVTIRQRKSFILNGFDVNPDCIQRLQRADGYNYGNEASRSQRKASRIPLAHSTSLPC
jgi:5-methylcytosine-specific restriction endonuclease McrA